MTESIKTAIRKKAAELVAKTKNKIKKVRMVIIFPGQGFQRLGMALLLKPDTRDRLFKLMQEFLKGDILFVNRLIYLITFDINSLGKEERIARESEINALQAELNDTRYAQLAIFVVSCGWIDEREQDERIPVAHYVLGLSLGEYAALYAAKIISFKDGLKIVYIRSQLMSLASVFSSSGGGMLAVKSINGNIKNRHITSAVKGTDAVIANALSQKKLTLSGGKEQLEGIRILLRGKGYAATFVPVSGAFHHPEYMKIVEDGLKLIISLPGIFFNKPKIKIVFNYSGGVEDDIKHIQNNLIHQVVGCVRLRGSIELLIKNKIFREEIVVPFEDKTILNILEDFKWPKPKELPAAV